MILLFHVPRDGARWNEISLLDANVGRDATESQVEYICIDTECLAIALISETRSTTLSAGLWTLRVDIEPARGSYGESDIRFYDAQFIADPSELSFGKDAILLEAAADTKKIEPWVQALSGAPIDLLALPDMHSLSEHDIAYSLGGTRRYNGHAPIPISVAEHSCIVADAIAESMGVSSSDITKAAKVRRWPRETIKTVYAGLMHDAHEAYIGDIVAPMKAVLGEPFRDLEHRMQAACAQRFGVTDDPAVRAIVRRYDYAALCVEHLDFFAAKARRDWQLVYDREAMQHTRSPLGWAPTRASAEFLRRFRALSIVS